MAFPVHIPRALPGYVIPHPEAFEGSSLSTQHTLNPPAGKVLHTLPRDFPVSSRGTAVHDRDWATHGAPCVCFPTCLGMPSRLPGMHLSLLSTETMNLSPE